MKESKRIADSELFVLIAQGSQNASDILDKRYNKYCLGLAKDYWNTHKNYGFSIDDFYASAMIGYCRARDSFNYELSEAFYPLFKKWALYLMCDLVKEGQKFYLNKNPDNFISLDSTVNENDDMLVAEVIGEEDRCIRTNLIMSETLDHVSSEQSRLNEVEQNVLGLLLSRMSKGEICKKLGLSYKKLQPVISSIKKKLKKNFIND